MSNVFDTQRLIDTVKRVANIPDNQSQVSDDDIIDFANEEFSNNLLPLIIGKHEDYYTIREDIEITDSTRKKYPIPYRAVGNKIEWFGFYQTNNEERPTEFNRVAYDQLRDHGNGATNYGRNRFYFENENVVIDSSDNDVQADFLTFRYNITPNTIVASTRVSVITGIDRTSGTITVSANIPDNFSSTSKIDFIKTKQPNNILNYDVDLVDLNSTAKFFQVDADDIPVSLEVGDRICLAGESDIIYAPTAMHAVLAQMVAVRVLESNGDDTRRADQTLAKMENNAQYLIDNRDTGSPVKASVRKNGLLRSRARKGRNRY
jgi:hypothetical protein